MTSPPHNWNLKNIQSSKSSLEDIGCLNCYIKNTWHTFTKNKNDSWSVPYFNDKELYFDKDPWNYYINKYGYRGDNWTFKKVPAFFGCSFTFGIGVETPFPALIQKQYSDDTVIPNIGIPGGSPISIIKSFVAFANLHPMSHAFISLPQIDRFHYSERCDDKWTFAQIVPNAATPKSQKRILSMWMGDMSRAFTTDYIDWAESVAESKGIKLFWGSWDNETYEFIKPLVANNFEWSPGDLMGANIGRDGAHPGPDIHKDMADRAWSIIN
jgi:hypothetical protein|tara:strand:+ start:1534 stop:2340 length:807 start_codon:yes stop_codon:yes gene_type:complete